MNIGGFIKIAGYEIPDIVKGLGQFAAMGSKIRRVDPQVYFFYLIYLMPIFSVLTIILGVTDKNTKVTGLVAGVMPIAALVYGLSQAGTVVFENMAIGAYLTLLTAMAMILSAFRVIKMPAQVQSVPASGKEMVLQIIEMITLLSLLVGLELAFFYAPTDAVQGNVQRIMYIHVPMAWVAYLAFFVVFISSIGYLWRKTREWDIVAHSSAELGVMFTTLAIMAGAVWGKPTWGTWWTWDARLTTTIILLLIYAAYLMLRTYSSGSTAAARHAAVLELLDFWIFLLSTIPSSGGVPSISPPLFSAAMVQLLPHLCS